MLHGIRKTSPATANAIERTDAFQLISWNYLYYQRHRDITRDLPWIEKLLAEDPPQPPEVNDIHTPAYRVAKILYQVGDMFPWLIPLIPDRRIKSSIRETEYYFRNKSSMACRIREYLKQSLREAAVRGDRVLLIGHSLGSVIAYDVLWELHHLEGIGECVHCFLTLGSPLGLKFVQHRLAGRGYDHPRRYPGNIRNWINISSRGDLVALDPVLQNDFREMLSHSYIESIDDKWRGVVNSYRDEKGLNVHRSYGYLANPLVAQAIADWWNGS